MGWSFGTPSDVQTGVTTLESAIKRYQFWDWTAADGRFTATMPHAEREFRNFQMSWRPLDSGVHSPWMQLWRTRGAGWGRVGQLDWLPAHILIR